MQNHANYSSSDFQELLQKYRVFTQTYLFPLDLSVVTGSFQDFLPSLNALREKAKNEGLFAPHLARSEGDLDSI